MTEHNRFTIYNEFVAALYDKRFYKKELDKKKFKDIYRAGFIINSLYDESKNGNMDSKNKLIKISELIEIKTNEFSSTYSELQSILVDQKEIKNREVKEPTYIPFQWANKMYLSLVDILLSLDESYLLLDTLKDNKLIETKKYWILRKKLTNPIRSILEKIYLSNK